MCVGGGGGRGPPPVKKSSLPQKSAVGLKFMHFVIMHISTACPGGTPPGQPGGNKGEFGILSVYSTRNRRLIEKNIDRRLIIYDIL